MNRKTWKYMAAAIIVIATAIVAGVTNSPVLFGVVAILALLVIE